MTAPAERDRPRHLVRELGPRCFVVDDTVSCLSYDMRFTRRVAQEAADRRNDGEESLREVIRADRAHFDRDDDDNRDED